MPNVTEKPNADVGVSLGNGENPPPDFSPTKDRDFEGSKGETFEGETQACAGTYPADCYSFMAIHGPFEPNGYFFFGFLVWAFQMSFLILLVLRVAHPRLSTNENDDNPDQDNFVGFAFAKFVPSNNNLLSRLTQYMALLSYCFFADASVKDIVTAVEMFPRFSRAQPGDKVGLIMTSCLFRFTQGLLSTIAVFLLVITTSDVIDIILNFTAVNFISDFDDIAFELCQWGKYGPALKKEADRIESLPAPACIYRKYQHVRYRYTVVPMAVVLLGGLVFISYTQYSLDTWLTTRLRIQFKDDPLRDDFNGCYMFSERQDRRVLLESYEANSQQAKIGYCLEKRKWFLFTGNKTDACSITEEEERAFSSKTYAFDISTVFEDTWYSPTGTPLELYFFDDTKNELTDDECGAFIGDGTCNDGYFNVLDHNFDNGDCCATTCNSQNCGSTNTLTQAFNTNVTSGNGYPYCIDPQMKPVTIKINNLYFPSATNYNISLQRENPFGDAEPIDPPLSVVCDEKNVLEVNIKKEMELQSETIWVPDGARCEVTIRNVTTGSRRVPFVNYTVYHGDENRVEIDPIVIYQGDSFEEGFKRFQRIPECFFEKLDSHVERSTIYTGDKPSNKAIEWLARDSLGNSNCEDDTFLERYALATINYAAPINISETEESSTELWIDARKQCDWANVQCGSGRVQDLDLGPKSLKGQLSGTIATELGLLKNLTYLDLSQNKLYGSLPSEIGELTDLSYFGVESNGLTGSIPTETGNMRSLEFLIWFDNQLNGTIPSELFEAPVITLALGGNALSGPIPNEIQLASSLSYLGLDNNSLTGTIPTMLGTLSQLQKIILYSNNLTGTIPSEFTKIVNLTEIHVAWNALTGSIPTELVEDDGLFLEYDGNRLSGLIPIDGQVICSTDESEGYCDCELQCGYSQRCSCDEAQSCCAPFYEKYTNCNVCPFGFENPIEVIPEYENICANIAGSLFIDVYSFGDEETCETVAKPFFNGIGCRCLPDSGENQGGEENQDDGAV